jgi:hypothetical protein
MPWWPTWRTWKWSGAKNTSEAGPGWANCLKSRKKKTSCGKRTHRTAKVDRRAEILEPEAETCAKKEPVEARRATARVADHGPAVPPEPVPCRSGSGSARQAMDCLRGWHGGALPPFWPVFMSDAPCVTHPFIWLTDNIRNAFSTDCKIGRLFAQGKARSAWRARPYRGPSGRRGSGAGRVSRIW